MISENYQLKPLKYTKYLTLFPIITVRSVFTVSNVTKRIKQNEFFKNWFGFNVLNIFEWPEMTYNDLKWPVMTRNNLKWPEMT